MATDAEEIKKKSAARRGRARRKADRDRLWPEAEALVYESLFGGWCQMPRTVPMIASLIDALSDKADAGRLYITLWSYDFGEGFVEIPDPVQVGVEAGHGASRAERGFRERIRILRDLGFIKTAPLGAREFGYVLLIDPHAVVATLRGAGQVGDDWWSSFVARCGRIGVTVPLVPPPLPPVPPPVPSP